LQWEWTDAQTLLRLPFSDTQAIVAPRSDRPSCCRGPAIIAVALHIDLDNAHPQIGPLLQVMPWPTYQNLSDRDLLAIYTYLSAIPAIRPQN
jgi:hypothetical protein